MKLIGSHVIINSRNPEADRVFFRDVLKLPHVDAGEGWLIFALPPAEAAFHPARRASHELYLMCDDMAAFVDRMKAAGVKCGGIRKLSWGRLSSISLPGGGKLGVYQPLHKRPGKSRAGRRQ